MVSNGWKVAKKRVCEALEPSVVEKLGSTAQLLCYSRGQEGLTLLLTVPELHSMHSLVEVMAWERNPLLLTGPCSPAHELHAMEQQTRPLP